MSYPNLAPPQNQYTAFLEDEARIGTLAAEDLHYRVKRQAPKYRGPAHAALLEAILAGRQYCLIERDAPPAAFIAIDHRASRAMSCAAE